MLGLPISVVLVGWGSLIRLVATKTEPGNTFNRFRFPFAESFDQRLCIPSIIYCMIFSSRRSDFVSQDRIRFELAIRISVWAHIIHAEYFLSKTLTRCACITKLSLQYALLK